jgi:hypothetical protein
MLSQTRLWNPNAKFDIPANATPDGILAAWKQDQLKRDFDPNATVVETLGGRK